MALVGGVCGLAFMVRVVSMEGYDYDYEYVYYS